MLCKCCGFSFPLWQEGRWNSAQKLGVILSVPGFSWPQPPLLLCGCHAACAGIGRSFSLWCDTWQKGMGNHTAFSFAPSAPYLHLWDLGFRVKMVETDVFHMGLWGLPVVLCGETDSVWLLQWPGVSRVLQSPCRNEHIIGVEAVWSLLEAEDCKSHICLRTNVKKPEMVEVDGHDTIHWRSSGPRAVSLQGFQKGLEVRNRVCLGVGWIKQCVGSAAGLPQKQAETTGESPEWSSELQ